LIHGQPVRARVSLSTDNTFFPYTAPERQCGICSLKWFWERIWPESVYLWEE
jgi:hypothetical protein